jgi:hypothetical protein
MANINKATKALAVGTDGMIILEPGVMFQRKANLPDNWTRIRIGFIGSFCGLSDYNAAPTAEALLNPVSAKWQSLIGMSNGVGFLGEAGNRFVGVGGQLGSEQGTNYGIAMRNGSANLWAVTNAAGSGTGMPTKNIVGNGVTIDRATTGAASTYQMDNPAGTTGPFFGRIMQFELSSSVAGSLLISQFDTTTNYLASATDAVLQNMLLTSTLSSQTALTGGWWTSSTTAIDLKHFCIRFPFLNNRLRLHNLMILDLSTY